ncbi:hypothetical protein E2C01_013414 [Portunus trituberculatus]|uniref:Uncharacterized protein n=1 Tax=Portunus trituberculatus TaxID=210409 RepID=A0A5B7DGL1_PORTR|nr:hypothetical protein [Portunus trituberculatus]
MQPPPNKDAPENIASTSMGSRPPSQLSQQASSGYGSTRSRKDEVTLIKPSSEESSKVAGGRGSSPKVDATSTGNRKTGSYGSAQNPTPSSSSSSSSPSSSYYPAQYPSQYPPQYQRNPSLYKQYPSSTSLKETQPSVPYTKSSNSRQSFSSSTFPHRMENQSHPATSYPNTNHSHTATSYPNSQSHAYPQPANTQAHPPKYPPGVVYADLALSRNGQPNHYRRDLNTEYAILQFKGPVVGQEIDPFKTSLDGGDMEYADVDYATYNYGPIPYKAASVSNAEEKKAEQEAEMKGVPVRPPRKK